MAVKNRRRRQPLRAPVNESWQELAAALAEAVDLHRVKGTGDPLERCASCAALVRRYHRKANA